MTRTRLRAIVQGALVLGLGAISLLTACTASPDSPTPVPPAPGVAATSTPLPAPPVAPTPSVAQPLVPAFPSSTVAFSGTGPQPGTMPFLLRGGSYRITWYAQPIGPAGTRTTWPLAGTIHEAGGSGPDLPLLRVDVPIGGAQTGQATAGPFAEGSYTLKVDADPLCNWTIQIHP